MATITSGSTASGFFGVTDSITITTRGTAKFECPVGTTVAEFSGTRTFGPYVALGYKITATAGDVQYEVGDGIPALSRPAAINNRMAVIGDSYDANGFVITSGTVTNVWEGNSGVLAMNEALGLPWDISYVGAVSGTTSTQWLATQLAGALASDAYHIWIPFPNNDPQTVGDYATTIANLTSMYSQATAAGKSIKVTTRGSLAGTWTAAQFALAKQISDWIVQTARANGWPIMDIESAIYDPSTGVGGTSVMLADTNHPNIPGFFFAAQQSVQSFNKETPRRAQRVGAATSGLYNPAWVGTITNPAVATTMVIPGWANYNSGGSQTVSASQVTRTDTQNQTFFRNVITSAAIGDRQGFNQTVNISTAVARSTAYVLGNSRLDSNGNRQVCTTAGTTGAGAPTWQTALGATTTDGTAVFTRVANITPGTSKFSLRADYDIGTVSGGDLSCQLTILINFTGSTGAGTIRAHSTGVAAATPGQRHTMTKTGRPGLSTPFDFVVPAGTTAIDVFVYFAFSAASVTATCDLYGLEMLIK